MQRVVSGISEGEADLRNMLDDDQDLWQEDDVSSSLNTANVSANLCRSGAGWAQVSPNLQRYASDFEVSRSPESQRLSPPMRLRPMLSSVSDQMVSLGESANFIDDGDVDDETMHMQRRLSRFARSGATRLSNENLWNDLDGEDDHTTYSPNLHAVAGDGRPKHAPQPASPTAFNSSSCDSDDSTFLMSGLESLMLVSLPDVSRPPDASLLDAAADAAWIGGLRADMSVDDLISYILRHRTTPARCLGIPADARVVAVRKRYMTLALRIHPDKSAHADASQAFVALEAAAKMLLRTARA